MSRFSDPLLTALGLRIEKLLASHQRPKAALCGIELRSPSPYSFSGFAEFNAEYARALEGWDLFVNGINPVARTNVAPVLDPPGEPALYGFSFTKPCAPDLRPTFVVAGAGELPEGELSREAIVAVGDTSPHGLLVKSRFVMYLMGSRLRSLGAEWPWVTTVNAYTAHSLTPLLPTILGPMGSAGVHGVHWHYCRPPIEDIEYEMDMRNEDRASRPLKATALNSFRIQLVCLLEYSLVLSRSVALSAARFANDAWERNHDSYAPTPFALYLHLFLACYTAQHGSLRPGRQTSRRRGRRRKPKRTSLGP